MNIGNQNLHCSQATTRQLQSAMQQIVSSVDTPAISFVKKTPQLHE